MRSVVDPVFLVGATSNNNAVIYYHLFYEVLMFVWYMCIWKQFNDIRTFNTEVQLRC